MTITVMGKPTLKDGKTDAHVEKPIAGDGKAEQVSISVSIPLFLPKLPLLPPRLRRVGSRFQPSSMVGKAGLAPSWLMRPSEDDVSTEPASSRG